MPRDHFRRLLEERVRANDRDLTGQIISPVRLTPYDAAGALMPVADVQLNRPDGVVTISNVPIAANNQELRHVALGSPIRLRRSATGRVEVIGLDKRSPGGVFNYTLNLSTGMSTSGNASGLYASVFTLGMLGSTTSGGFGTVAFMAVGQFTAAGSFVAIIWP